MDIIHSIFIGHSGSSSSGRRHGECVKWFIRRLWEAISHHRTTHFFEQLSLCHYKCSNRNTRSTRSKTLYCSLVEVLISRLQYVSYCIIPCIYTVSYPLLVPKIKEAPCPRYLSSIVRLPTRPYYRIAVFSHNVVFRPLCFGNFCLFPFSFGGGGGDGAWSFFIHAANEFSFAIPTTSINPCRNRA